MIQAILTNPYSIFIPFLLASFVGYVTYRNNRKVRYANACAAFRAAVLAKFPGVYPIPTTWPANPNAFFRSVFSDLQVAFQQFRPFVPLYKRWLFDRAWFKYRCATGRKIDLQCYHHYMDFSNQPDPKIVFRQNVDRLLSFAKQT